MNINTNSLVRAMKSLPIPKHTADYYTLRIPNKIEEINMENGMTRVKTSSSSKPFNVDIQYQTVNLIAVPYCIGGKCWHEWELVL